MPHLYLLMASLSYFAHKVYSICKSYQNIYPNMYTLAETFDLENLLVQAGPFENLDEGFDVYATQAFNAPDGRHLRSVDWLPEITYPSDVEGWANGLSLVKELTHNGNYFNIQFLKQKCFVNPLLLYQMAAISYLLLLN